ncbi:hypothetical protein Hanom_Chr11g01039871 [Helianthus anomalus]
MLMSPARRMEVAVRRLVLLKNSSGSSGSRNPDAGATPSSIAHEEQVEEEEEEPAVKLVRKRSRETTAGASEVPKPGGVPFIGKQSNLCSLYRFSPGKKEDT